VKLERIAACPRIALIAVLLAGTLPAAAPRRLVAQDVAQAVRDLGSSDATVRATAACALGRAKDVAAARRARSRLLELLTDDTPVDGKLCRRWENRWGEQGSTPGREAAIALEEFGTVVLEPLVDILDGRNTVGR